MESCKQLLGRCDIDAKFLKVAGRILTVEDIELAERDCRKKFGAHRATMIEHRPKCRLR